MNKERRYRDSWKNSFDANALVEAIDSNTQAIRDQTEMMRLMHNYAGDSSGYECRIIDKHENMEDDNAQS